MGCLFCEIIKGNLPKCQIYEDDKCIVILDKFPQTKGHCLVMSKSHYETVFDIDEEIYSHLAKIAVKISKVLKERLKCDGINIIQNNGFAAGQAIDHVHIHIIPRYTGDSIELNKVGKELTDEDMISLLKEVS